MDIVPALEKPSAREPLRVGGSNGSLNLKRSIVRLYFGEKHKKNTWVSYQSYLQYSEELQVESC